MEPPKLYCPVCAAEIMPGKWTSWVVDFNTKGYSFTCPKCKNLVNVTI
jgi:hypothetical protein